MLGHEIQISFISHLLYFHLCSQQAHEKMWHHTGRRGMFKFSLKLAAAYFQFASDYLGGWGGQRFKWPRCSSGDGGQRTHQLQSIIHWWVLLCCFNCWWTFRKRKVDQLHAHLYLSGLKLQTETAFVLDVWESSFMFDNFLWPSSQTLDLGLQG